MKIKGIIREELKNMLIESNIIFRHENLNFNQNVKNATFNGYPPFSSEFDADVTQSDLYVAWEASFWLNDAGFENFLIDIHKITGEFVTELYDKQSDELKQTINKDISEFKWKYIFDDVALRKGGDLYIKDMTFNFDDNSCYITFQ